MENEKGVPEVDFPLLTHLLFYFPQIYTDFHRFLTSSKTEQVSKSV